MKSKRKKQPEVQKRTQPKRHKQKIGEEVPSQTSRPAPASTNKENSGISNQKQRRANDVRNDDDDTVAKGKSIESRSSLMEAAKSGCRKCTLEWQTNTKDPTKHHDSCCPRANSSRLVNTQQQLNLNASKNSSRTPLPPNSSPIVEKKKAVKVIPRPLPPIREARHTCAPSTMTMADTSTNIGQTEQSIVIDVDSNLFNYALQKGFSAAFLRGKTEEELLGLLSSSRDGQQSVETILPPFIRDFIAEADRNNEIPAPRGTKWLSCPNPWGKIGHEEGDFVVISPFQSESTADMVSIFHQCSNGNIPKRFVANPLKEGSPYNDTHRSPARKGYSVLRLTRDRMGLRPWGFTVRLHEFGGACLVDSIEPLSPAEAADDISGWTDKGAPVGLQLHDMIICVNGKSVGCMTEAELQLDLELCGSEMTLVVARFDIEGNIDQDVTLADLAMEWNDIGAGAHPRKKTVCFEDEESSINRYDLDLIPKNTSIQVQERPDSESHDDGNDRPEPESQGDDNDDSANEEENENGNDGLDGAKDAASFDWVPRSTSELESKSDEVLMRQLINTVEAGKWKQGKDSQLAKLLAKRGFLAAANDERFQRFSCNSGGVTKEQVLEWMSRSETFQQYERTVRAKWSESTFQKKTWDALKDVGYTKVSGGGSGVLARYALPEDILSRELQFENVMNQNYQSDEEGTSEDDDGPEDTSFDRVPKVNSELESKSDEVLMRQLIDTVEAGNWDTHKGSQMAKLLARRGFLAAANDERFQRLSCNCGGVTKEQALEWMSRSETFQHYERTVRAKWSEGTLQNRTSDALKDVGYTKIRGGRSGGLARYDLPEDILSRELQLQNVTSQNYQSDDDATSDEEDSDNRKQGKSKIVAVENELESKTNEELMEMLREGIKVGALSQSARVLAKRACISAAQDEIIQKMYIESGGVTKAQIFDWMDKSETFHDFKDMVLTKTKEASFMNRLSVALTSAGYVRFGGGSNTRWALPEDIVPRVEIESAVGELHESENNASEKFESKSNEELMEMLKGGVKTWEWTQLSNVLAQRACLAAAEDEHIQQMNRVSGAVTKAEIIDWMDESETFHGYKEMVLTKTKEASFMSKLSDALKYTGYNRLGGGATTRWALPRDIADSENNASEKFDSKSNEELMEMLKGGVKSWEWTQLSNVLAQRACLAAAQSDHLRQMNRVSGGVTKTQIIDWINESTTFKQYENFVRKKVTEKTFENRMYDALTRTGYVRFGGGTNTRWVLPEEDTVPRVGNNVVPNASKQNEIENADSTAGTGKRKRSDTFAKRKKQFYLHSDDSQSSLEEESESEEEEEEDDDNPWLGCVCGRTHPPPIQVFWIQCGTCDAWHNVAEDCVGFSEEVADTIDDWHCWSCNPPCAGLNL
eukprot:scaffold2632_cov124-Skeletonema_menzelii.AAC.15